MLVNRYDLSGEYGIGYTRKGESFYFDLEDYDLIKDYAWYIDDKGYVVNRNYNKGSIIKMHILIFGKTEGKVIDHKNQHKNDNRKSNLRHATCSQNIANRVNKRVSKSGYVGVYWHTSTQSWNARIMIDKHEHSLGTFKNKTDALIARLKAEKEYYGDFAPQRHLFSQYNI